MSQLNNPHGGANAPAANPNPIAPPNQIQLTLDSEEYMALERQFLDYHHKKAVAGGLDNKKAAVLHNLLHSPRPSQLDPVGLLRDKMQRLAAVRNVLQDEYDAQLENILALTSNQGVNTIAVIQAAPNPAATPAMGSAMGVPGAAAAASSTAGQAGTAPATSGSAVIVSPMGVSAAPVAPMGPRAAPVVPMGPRAAPVAPMGPRAAPNPAMSSPAAPPSAANGPSNTAQATTAPTVAGQPSSALTPFVPESTASASIGPAPAGPARPIRKITFQDYVNRSSANRARTNEAPSGVVADTSSSAGQESAIQSASLAAAGTPSFASSSTPNVVGARSSGSSATLGTDGTGSTAGSTAPRSTATAPKLSQGTDPAKTDVVGPRGSLTTDSQHGGGLFSASNAGENATTKYGASAKRSIGPDAISGASKRPKSTVEDNNVGVDQSANDNDGVEKAAATSHGGTSDSVSKRIPIKKKGTAKIVKKSKK